VREDKHGRAEGTDRDDVHVAPAVAGRRGHLEQGPNAPVSHAVLRRRELLRHNTSAEAAMFSCEEN